MNRLLIFFIAMISYPISAYADLNSDIYLEAKRSYEQDKFSETVDLLEKFINDNRSFLSENPDIHKKINLVIKYCVIRIVLKGADGDTVEPELP